MAGTSVPRPAEPGSVRCGHHKFRHLDSPMRTENLLCRQEQGRRLPVGAAAVSNLTEVVNPNLALACHQGLSAPWADAVAREPTIRSKRVDE